MDESQLFFFESEHFAAPLAHQASYLKARPFAHAVIDNFLPQSVARRIASEFPPPSFSSYKQPDNPFQIGKLGRVQENDFKGLPPFVRHMLNEFNGKIFLDFLEKLTGVEGLIADPHFLGGALHQILPGGKLAVHADFNLDRRRKLDRRVNVLIYFNDDWRDEYRGHLELWDDQITACQAKIAPIFNRCVIFNTTSTSFHGHPDPLECPPNRTRNSIALYYYTNGRPDQAHETPHDTLWRVRPGETSPLTGETRPPAAGARWKKLAKRFLRPLMS